MQRKRYPLILFAITLLLYATGIGFKTLQLAGGAWILISGILFTIAYTAFCILEVFSTRRLSPTEKIVLLGGFLLLNILTGLFYFIYVRKHILLDTRYQTPDTRY